MSGGAAAARSGQDALMHSPVGLVGAGRMGAPMAVNLARSGRQVMVWTRTVELSEELAAAGVVRVESLSQLGRACSVVLTVLPDLPEVVEVCDGPGGLLAGAAPGTVVVVMGTVSPPRLRGWTATVGARGHAVVDAPVSGGVEGARTATLSVMVGGEPAHVEAVLPVLQVLGATVRHLGPVGSGQVAKACNQAVVAGTLAVLAEAVTLGGHAGLDTAELLELLGGGLAGSRALQDKTPRYVGGDFRPGGAARFQHKDLGFVLESARELGVAVPVTALVDQLFGAMRWTGRGDLDHSGVIEIVRLLSGDRTAGEDISGAVPGVRAPHESVHEEQR